jgi:hypothetical protein
MPGWFDDGPLAVGLVDPPSRGVRHPNGSLVRAHRPMMQYLMAGSSYAEASAAASPRCQGRRIHASPVVSLGCGWSRKVPSGSTAGISRGKDSPGSSRWP